MTIADVRPLRREQRREQRDVHAVVQGGVFGKRERVVIAHETFVEHFDPIVGARAREVLEDRRVVEEGVGAFCMQCGRSLFEGRKGT